jgi:hypothetical protein
VEEPREAQLVARYEAVYEELSVYKELYEGTLLCIISRIGGASRGQQPPQQLP